MRNLRGALALAALVTFVSHPVRAGEEQIVPKEGAGRDLAVGPPAEIRDNPLVHTAYLGVKDETDAAGPA